MKRRRTVRPPQALTPVHLQVLSGLAAGENRKQISNRLTRSLKTIDYHILRIRLFFGARTIIQAVAVAIRKGVLQ